jgi:tetrapyrrole methylase family protein / MazG family protein
VSGRIIVVGLGPGGPDLVTAGTLDRIQRATLVVLRTTRHPAAVVLDTSASDAVESPAGAVESPAGAVESFDHVYEEEADLEAVYARIAAELVATALDLADAAELVYAVPGSPLVAERTVELLAVAAPAAGVELVVEAALSFADLAWVRLGVDPVAAGVRLVDGQRFESAAAGERGPFLVAQCDSPAVLSAVKLALDGGEGGIDPTLSPSATVTVLHHLGLPDEAVTEVAWTDLDQIEPDHLTSLYVPALAAPIAAELTRFVELVATLREQCPWDREQTHHSLRRHLLEESYELLEAIDELDVGAGLGFDHLQEELGDLLFQVAFHSRLAAEEGQFTMADVARGVHDKLVERHPHIFAGVDAADVETVVGNWEQIKKAEKNRESVFDGVPATLPALLYASKVQKKAASLDLVPDDQGSAYGFDELSDEVFGAALGELLFAIVDRARRAGVDPEDALRTAAVAHRDRWRDEERTASS